MEDYVQKLVGRDAMLSQWSCPDAGFAGSRRGRLRSEKNVLSAQRGCLSSTRQDARRDRKGGLLTGEGADVSKRGRDGDDRDAAGVGCYRNSSSAGTRWVGMLMPTSVPERAFDAPIGTSATETTHPLIVAIVPGKPQRDRERLLGRLLSNTAGRRTVAVPSAPARSSSVRSDHTTRETAR